MICLATELTVAQTYTVDQVHDLLKYEGQTLDTTVFDAVEVYDRPFDGGGEILLIRDQHQSLVACISNLGLSNGRIRLEIFYANEIPIAIRETESKFVWVDSLSTFDYTFLEKAYYEEVFILNWEMGESKHLDEGKRFFTEARCGIFEYEREVMLGLQLFQQEVNK